MWCAILACPSKACTGLGQHRSTQRKAPRATEDEAALTADIVELARRYGRYGYRRVTALLRQAGWAVNRKRVERPWHVWAYDFVEDRTRDGRKFRLLCVVDEFSREALAIRVARKLSSADVIDVLADLFTARGVPAHIRSDQGPEFVAKAVQGWIHGIGAKTAYIEPGSPWENGYVESF